MLYIVPLYICHEEFPTIELMKGLYLQRFTAPGEWKSEGANLFLVIDYDAIEVSDFYDSEHLYLEDVVQALHRYVFFRTYTSLNISMFGNVVYEVTGNLTNHRSYKLISADDSMKYVPGPWTSALEFQEEPKLHEKLSDGHEHFAKYLKFTDAEIPKTEKLNPIYFATNALSAGFDKQQSFPELHIISIFTALEALFSKDQYELVFQLSHNLSVSLFPDQSRHTDRIEFNRVFKKLYNARSRIVHGKSSIEETSDAYRDSIELIRYVMRIIIEDYSVPDEFFDFKRHEKFIESLQVGYLSLSTPKIKVRHPSDEEREATIQRIVDSKPRIDRDTPHRIRELLKRSKSK